MLKAAKIESNRSKFPDRSTQNIDQENLLVEFIRENNSNKNDNCTNSCQNISNQLMFERMILNHFHINASNYWKLSKIWVMIELKNSNFKLHKCVSSPLEEDNAQLTERRSLFSQYFFLLALPELSQLYNWELSLRLGHV